MSPKTINYINENYPEIFTIADAKRGDIGIHPNVRQSFFEDLNFDSVTVAPYMEKTQWSPFSIRKQAYHYASFDI
jgi:orotidine-5'-phosphate decarboxylase